MPILQAGSYALVKVGDTEEGEHFQILHVDPAQAHRAGYIWTSTDNLTEAKARELLRSFSEESRFPALFKAARGHFKAQQ